MTPADQTPETEPPSGAAGPRVGDDPDDCHCEFDPYEDDDEESWHFRRTCPHCGEVWWGLHCPHDGAQNPCPGCGLLPSGRHPVEFLLPGWRYEP